MSLPIDRSQILERRLRVVRDLSKRCVEHRRTMREFRSIRDDEFVDMTLDDVSELFFRFTKAFADLVHLEGAVRSLYATIEKTLEDNLSLEGANLQDKRMSKESRDALVCSANPVIAKLRDDYVKVRSFAKTLGVTGQEKQTYSRGILKIINMLELRIRVLGGDTHRRARSYDEDDE